MKTMRPLRVFGGGLSCVATPSLDRSSFNTEPGLRFSRFGCQTLRCSIKMNRSFALEKQKSGSFFIDITFTRLLLLVPKQFPKLQHSYLQLVC